MKYYLSTESAPPNERLSYWVDAVCNSYVKIDCQPGARTAFHEGSIRGTRIGELGLTLTCSTAQTISRTNEHLSRHSDDTFQVSLQIGGHCVVEQNGREALVDTGDIVFYDCAAPFKLSFPDALELMIVKIPRSLLAHHVRDAEQFTALPIKASTGIGQLLRSMIREFLATTDGHPQNTAAVKMLVETIVCATVAGIYTLPSFDKPDESKLTRYHIRRAKDYIRQHLSEATLDPAHVAAALKISESYLYRLFKSESTSICKYIWTERLQTCHADLSQPRLSGHSVTEIALSRGFSDMAHFSRSFRSHYGVSPKEWRAESSKSSEGEG